VVVPTGGRDSVVLFMPIWSPGMYSLMSYGDRVTAFAAFAGRAADGAPLTVRHPDGGHWVVQTGGRPAVTVTYTVSAPRGSNLSNGVTDTSLVVVGPATFVGLAGETNRPAEVRLALPAGWKPAATSLDPAPNGAPNDFVAPDYDVLADSPILAGTHMSSAELTVGGVKHRWAYLGDAEWSAAQAAEWLRPLLEEHRRFWGTTLPLHNYVFLNIVGANPGSGVEHLNSVAINTNGKAPQTREARFRKASFISHEYFHAMNVKRLRPVELGPFDYEHTPATTGLWVAEELTSYFGDLLAARSGLGDAEDYLALLSRHITDLQKSPGRLVQTLEQASSQMFERVPRDRSVDYYVKGPVVGFVLDAHIRKHTGGRRSMDDVIRLEFDRWSGARGFTAEDFARTASDAAGFDVGPLLHTLVATTAEVDYTEALDWFGLRFAPNTEPANAAKAWTLEVRPDATAEQRAHLAALLAPSGGR
jgi:predicted metalloprotease with PDZ domain